MSLTFVLLILIVAGVSWFYFSHNEYWLHRKIMHEPLVTPFGLFVYPYEAHAKVHHHVFKADHTYHLQNEKDKWTIPMKWWNGPVLVTVSTIPAILVGWLLGHTIAITLTVWLVGWSYYGAYEYIHWCMHLPRKGRRLIEKAPITGRIFKRLNGHHILHHRYMGKNFNVVFPFFDWVYGTLITRSRIPFPQPQGPCVPDVQPL